MSLVPIPGMPAVPYGMFHRQFYLSIGNLSTITLDATLEASHMIGRFFWADGGSHTIDTTGSSSMGWRAGTCVFSNVGSTLTIGLATVDTSTGPPGRATNVADLITFSVSAVLTGGGGGITTLVWNETVPTTGTMTIATGDIVAFCHQMTVRAGSDSVTPAFYSAITATFPGATRFIGAAYSYNDQAPNAIITASDGTLGWFVGGCVGNLSLAATTYGSGSSPNEVGNYLSFGFPTKIYGFFGLVNPAADFSAILYSDPLGTPVPERTVAVDLNTVSQAAAGLAELWFDTPYSAAVNQPLVIAVKPTTASTIATYYISLANAAHQVVYGANGYAVSRSSGAFAAVNSSKDRYTMGVFLGAFDDATGSGGGGMRMAGGGGLAGGP